MAVVDAVKAYNAVGHVNGMGFRIDARSLAVVGAHLTAIATCSVDNRTED